MADKIKIFNESDFDKDKQLFTPEDFEKEKDVPKDPKPTPKPNGGEGNGLPKGSKSKIYGGIAAAVVAGLLCYCVYSYFSSSDEQQDDGSTTQVEKVSDTPNEEDNKDTNNVETAGTSGTKAANSGDSANDESVTAPEQEATSAEATLPQSEQEQDGATKPTKPSKATTTAAQPATLSGSLEEKAKEVIRGNYGNGEVRKQKLGEQYSEIQSKVNEMYRNGQVQ